jgi:hypothetical protein
MKIKQIQQLQLDLNLQTKRMLIGLTMKSHQVMRQLMWFAALLKEIENIY